MIPQTKEEWAREVGYDLLTKECDHDTYPCLWHGCLGALPIEAVRARRLWCKPECGRSFKAAFGDGWERVYGALLDVIYEGQLPSAIKKGGWLKKVELHPVFRQILLLDLNHGGSAARLAALGECRKRDGRRARKQKASPSP